MSYVNIQCKYRNKGLALIKLFVKRANPHNWKPFDGICLTSTSKIIWLGFLYQKAWIIDLKYWSHFVNVKCSLICNCIIFFCQSPHILLQLDNIFRLDCGLTCQIICTFNLLILICVTEINKRPGQMCTKQFMMMWTSCIKSRRYKHDHIEGVSYHQVT